MVTVYVDNEPILLRVDTVADVTVAQKSYLATLNIILQTSNLQSYGPESNSLSVVGKFSARLIFDTRNCVQNVFVANDLSQPLLRWPAVKALSILQSLNENKFVQMKISLFTGLGIMKCENDIK